MLFTARCTDIIQEGISKIVKTGIYAAYIIIRILSLFVSSE